MKPRGSSARRLTALAGAFAAFAASLTVAGSVGSLGAAVVPGAVGGAAGSWSTPKPISATALYSVSCASERFCVAVGAGGTILAFDGSRWRESASFPSVERLWSVDCPSVHRCVAVGDHGMVTFFNGSRWSSPVDDDPGRVLSAVACWSPAECIVGDSSALVFALNGTDASLPASVDRYADYFTAYTSMSCAPKGRTLCAVVDSSGSMLTWQHGRWSSAQLSTDPPVVSILAADVLSSVSCATATECVAVTDAGSIVTWNGRTWSSPETFDPHGLVSAAIDCPSAARCLMVDDGGDAYTFQPAVPSATGLLGKFTGPVQTGLNESLPVSMSCASPTFCAVVTGGGEATIYHSSSRRD